MYEDFVRDLIRRNVVVSLPEWGLYGARIYGDVTANGQRFTWTEHIPQHRLTRVTDYEAYMDAIEVQVRESLINQVMFMLKQEWEEAQ